MELTYRENVTVVAKDATGDNRLKLSALLYYVQQISGSHSALLGADRTAMAEKNLFWVVLRHKIQLHRLPEPGEQLSLCTWPLPATRTAYPRAVTCTDANGEPVFQVMSLWGLMDIDKRTMVLPGKSGVEVPGIIRGCEPESPGSLLPVSQENTQIWDITREDLDENGHVNNTKYMDQVQRLCAQSSCREMPKQITVCYLAETFYGQQIQLNWTDSQTGIFSVDGCRRRTDVPEKTERVFAAKLIF